MIEVSCKIKTTFKNIDNLSILLLIFLFIFVYKNFLIMDINIKEEWKDIENYEGYYQVSNLSRIRSLDRVIKYKKISRFLKGKIMNKNIKSNGYKFVVFTKNGSHKNFLTHRLVAIAFIDNPYNLKIVEHKDGDRLNDYIENLFWSTHKDNMNNKNVKRKSNDVEEKNKLRININKLRKELKLKLI